jgi:hypothetical protein
VIRVLVVSSVRHGCVEATGTHVIWDVIDIDDIRTGIECLVARSIELGDVLDLQGGVVADLKSLVAVINSDTSVT